MRDSYKVKQLTQMLAHETDPNEEHYGANLTHWYGDSKPLTIDAGGLEALIAYYSGSDDTEKKTGCSEGMLVTAASNHKQETAGKSAGMPVVAMGSYSAPESVDVPIARRFSDFDLY